MTQYHNVRAKLSSSQLDKLKYAIKNTTGVPLTLFKNMIGKNETKIQRNLIITDRKVLSLCKASANNSLENIKLSTSQL